MQNYNPTESEKKWQAKWRESGIFKMDLEAPGKGGGKGAKGKGAKSKGKYYNLTKFPYPSGDKLHVGHWYN